MKRIIVIALIAGAAASTQAQTQSQPQAPPSDSDENAVQIHGPKYTIELPAKPFHLAPYEFDTYRGVYLLSNGEDMRLRQRGPGIYAVVGDRPEQELVAAALNVFVAKNRNLKVTLFNEDNSDRITGEVLIRTVPSLADNGA